jgi:hypothetical protein
VAFTFTNDPANSNRDAVRVLINDRTETGHRVSDETITWLLSTEASVVYAAAAAAELVAGQFADAVTTKAVGDLRLTKGDSAGNVAGSYRALAARLRRQAAMNGAAPFSGGISVNANDLARDDSDWSKPQISVGMDDNPPVTSTGTTGSVFY